MFTGLPRRLTLTFEVAGGAQARVGLERLLGARHVEAVDRLEPIAVLQAERAEQRVGADAEQANADDLAVLLLGHDARRAHQLGLVLQDLVDDGAVDVELGVADLLDLGGDVGRHRGAASRDRAAAGRRAAALAGAAGAAGAAPAGGCDSEQQRLAERRAVLEPDRGAVLARVEADEGDLLAADVVAHAAHARLRLARPLQRGERPLRIGRLGDDDRPARRRSPERVSGSLDDRAPRAPAASRVDRAWRSSGPVTESNGLRVMIGSAVVALAPVGELAEAARPRRRRRALRRRRPAPSAAPTSCVAPAAWKYAASAISTSTTTRRSTS